MFVRKEQFTRGLDEARAEVASFSGSLGSALEGFGGALAAGAIVHGLVDCVRATSSLIEMTNKANVAFGAASARIVGAADEMATAFGTPKAQFIDAAASIGLIGKAAGYGEKAAAGLGASFGKLATDVSSFYHIPIEESLMALQSGLVGQVRPLRRFGVLLSDARVNAEAARMGFERLDGEFSEGAKVQARAALITKDLADAQGDLARTAETTANRTRELGGRIENLKASAGEAIEPLANLGLAAGTGLAKQLDKGILGLKYFFSTIKNAGLGGSMSGELLKDAVAGPIEQALGKAFGGKPKELDLGVRVDESKLAAARDALDAIGAAARKAFDEVKTPAERLQDRLGELNNLWAVGAIDASTYVRAIAKAREEFDRSSGAKRMREEMAEDAARLKEEVLTPLEKFRAEMEKAQELHTGGLIGDADLARKAAMLRKDLLGDLGDAGGYRDNAALELGSKEARSTILASLGSTADGDPIKQVADLNKVQVEQGKQSLALLAQIAKNAPAGAAQVFSF